MKRSTAWILVLAAVLAVSCGWFGGHDKEATGEAGEEGEAEGEGTGRLHLSEEAEQALRLEFVTAEVREMKATVELAAEVVPDPDRHAEIGAMAEGRVVEVEVRVGDLVERNAPVVVINSPAAGDARADYLAARASLDVARATNDREAALLRDRATSGREVSAAEGELRMAEAAFSATRARLTALGLSTDIDPESPSAQLVLRSPIAGEVTRRDAHIGENVTTDDDLIEVIDLDHLWLIAGVYEGQVSQVRAGQEAEIEVRALPGERFHGVVDTVGAALDVETRTAPVRILLDNADHRLKPGMFATARISGSVSTEGGRSALLVPWAAVQEVDGRRVVFVEVEEGEFELRPVRIGERASGEVEIVDGLKAGEKIVGEGSFSLKAELLKNTLEEEEE